MKQFHKLLVANRGEIAIRIMRSAREMGITTMAICPESDAVSRHCSYADEWMSIGKGKKPLDAYLDAHSLAQLAAQTGCDAVHPGYGFLSESAAFADVCRGFGVHFVGPSTQVMEGVADKIAARGIAKEVGVPCIPGISRPVDLEEALTFGRDVGYPVMIKAAGGGGGRGIRLCRNDYDIERLFPEALRECEKAFNSRDVFVERFIASPKHIEVQILGDSQGNLVHLFERDCSIQRRFQKMVEVAPAMSLPHAVREAMLDAAVRIGRRVGYDNAGTVEFLYSPETEEYFFMEMNARLQVEHTVTEEITGIDLVKAQIRIAEGAALDHPDIGITAQDSIEARGVAIECRLTSENPTLNFQPDFGRVEVFSAPAGPGIRVDEALAHSDEISPFFDSMLAKITTRGRNMKESVDRMRRALTELRVKGVATNTAFLRDLVGHPVFVSGHARTDFIEKHLEMLVKSDQTSLNAPSSSATDPKSVSGDGKAFETEQPPLNAKQVLSSLPGLVVSVNVKPGDVVEEDEILMLIESMKIEITVRSPEKGRVTEIHAHPGEIVSADAPLVTFV